MNKIAYFYPRMEGLHSPVLEVPVPKGTTISIPLALVVKVIIEDDASKYYCDISLNGKLIIRSTLLDLTNVRLPGNNRTSGFVTKFNLQNIEAGQQSVFSLKLVDKFDNVFDETNYHVFFYEVPA